MFGTLINILYWAVNSIFGGISGGIQWTVDSVVYMWNVFWLAVQDSISNFASWAFGLLPPEVAGFFDLAANPAWGYLADVSAIVPVYGWIALAGSVYGVCGGIRLVRWIIGFVPTIEG